MRRAEPPTESLAGHYAGPVTRLVAHALDTTLSVTLYGVVLSLIAFAWQAVAGASLQLPAENSSLWAVGLGVWVFAYFAVSWAVASKTPGMAALGLRVVRRDGGPLGVRRAVVRTVAFPLSALAFGLGFIGILVGRERRALHDVLAGTTVVYDWDARSARWRLLTRRAS